MSYSRTFLAQTEIILQNFNDTRRETVQEAMKRISEQTFKYVHSMYVKDLFSELVKTCTPTTMIASLADRICGKLHERRKITLRNMVMKWTLEEAEDEFRKNEQRSTRIWREEISKLRRHNVNGQFERILESERKLYKTYLRKKRRKKVKFLRNKYRRERRIVPDEVDGIIIKDQPIPDDFTTEPRVYGGVNITEPEKELLSLPPKFAMYDKIEPKKCEAEVEKALTKLRWERISKEADTLCAPGM